MSVCLYISGNIDIHKHTFYGYMYILIYICIHVYILSEQARIRVLNGKVLSGMTRDEK